VKFCDVSVLFRVSLGCFRGCSWNVPRYLGDVSGDVPGMFRRCSEYLSVSQGYPSVSQGHLRDI
jgi:hypothetical protein